MKNYIENPLHKQEQELTKLLFSNNKEVYKKEKNVSIDLMHKEIFFLFQELKTTK